ncbi:DUF432 domain-containing protein [Mangrovibacterium diazotrophicum]|uniref:Uncharacterized protein DUF432 n=1 Tax=Mangrovibacterium diazotrophicum TaxID=1261403 RepID=A0A419W6P6_9BACT|nr:DUF432 domain-containing protein [Mangrovibacterium diazotrophicum]RKD91137.1 uncharacterized protein DUF432 [Mangrovibacterium diazotrophicum]
MPRQKNIWGKHEGKLNQQIQFESGFCSLQLKYFTGGWSVVQQKKAEPVAEATFQILNEDTNLPDAHLFQTGRSANLFIQPALPPKSVVFRGNKKIIIRPHQTLRIYIATPIYIQLYYKQVDADHFLAEYETERITDTWFGEPDSGSPAFSVGSRFATTPEELDATKYEIIVPVNIQNNTTQLLDLQRLLIRVELMNVYLVGDHLMADLETIEFKGQGQVGNLHFSTDKAVHGSSPLLISKARQASNRTILGHSFHFIKQMTQL